MTTRAAWLINPGQTRNDTRMAPIGTYTPVDAMQSRAGVIPGGTGLALSGSGMTATISTGRCLVQGTSAQGAFPVAVTASEAVVLTNGHASLVRTDLIVAKIFDNIVDGSGSTLATITKVDGTPGAGAPATPAGCLALYQVAVPAGASAGSPPNWASIVTDVRPFTVAVGGINPSGGPAVAGAYAGQYRDGTNGLERWSGSAWVGVGTWQAHTPTWTSTGTTPSLGNGTLVSRYCRIGKTIFWSGALTCGSTTSGGTGIWFMSPPTPAANLGLIPRGMADYVVSSSNNYAGECTLNPADPGLTFVVKTSTSSQSYGFVTNAVPVAVSSSAALHWNITYESAS
ncbi:hypothetical protein [Kitasatospora sp. NPDC050543]|uniref:hypothetical protein n=1 Tax=Kitasatospora sp. NPDC050543 TaxID=3364054 RepID=UPI0037A03886